MCVSGEGGYNLLIVSMPDVVFRFHCVLICTIVLSLLLTPTGLQSEKENHTRLPISRAQKGKQRWQLFIAVHPVAL